MQDCARIFVSYAASRYFKVTPGCTNIMAWSAFLDYDSDVLFRLEKTLSADELSRAAKFRIAGDRNRYIAARGVLRKLLATRLGKDPRDLQFAYGPKGKPSLRHSDPSAPRLQFNVSHSHGLAVYAVARDRNLGVDVELARSGFDSEGIARRYFSAREMQELRSLPAEKRTIGFFNCWTRKEAYIKADGRGLEIALDSFDVTLLPGMPARFLRGVPAGWQLKSFVPAAGYVSALAYDGPPCEVEQGAFITASEIVQR